jgi:hypothetical protein
MLTQNLPFPLMQTSWAQQLNPILSNKLLNGVLLQNVSLASGSNTVNHLLGRKLVGWVLTRQRAAATVYDTQDTNPHSLVTLQLTASAPTSVDLWVF